MPSVTLQAGNNRQIAGLVQQTIAAAVALHGRAPVERISFVQDEADALLFRYRITLADGRQWRQDMRYRTAADRDPPMTFTTAGDAWQLSESIGRSATPWCSSPLCTA